MIQLKTAHDHSLHSKFTYLTHHIVKMRNINSSPYYNNNLPRKTKKIILGDFNEKVSTNGTDTYPEHCGKYGLGLMNDEGERLLNFCALNHLAVMNTLYKQSRKRLTTWISSDWLTKNQIDYVLVPIDRKGLIKNCRVFNPADISSHHSLLMAKYTIFFTKSDIFQVSTKTIFQN